MDIIYWKIRKWKLLAIFITLLPVIVILDFPFLRQILGFIGFLIVPGYLILSCIDFGRNNLLEKAILSVALSVSFLLIGGFVIDQFYFGMGITKPLSPDILVFSLSITLLFLVVVIGRKEKNTFLSPRNFFEKSLSGIWEVFSSPTLIFPLIFPCLSIIGSHLMNAQGSNVLFLGILFLIPLYFAFVSLNKIKIPNRVYPVALLTISLALLLMHSLNSSHVMGSDIPNEFYSFRITTQNLHWSLTDNVSISANSLNSTLLPTVFYSIFGISKHYIFKLIYPLIATVIPLTIYVTGKRYLRERFAFLAGLLLIFQHTYIIRTQGSVNIMMGLFFTSVIIMVIFSRKVTGKVRKLLLVIFTLSMVVSYLGATAQILITFSLFCIGCYILNRIGVSTKSRGISLPYLIVFSGLSFLWYDLNWGRGLSITLGRLKRSVYSIAQLFSVGTKGQNVQKALSASVSLPYKIRTLVIIAVYFLVLIGIIRCILTYQEDKIDVDFTLLGIISGCLYAGFLIAPVISRTHGTLTVYTLFLPILAIFFAKAGNFISEFSKPSLGSSLLVFVLVLQLFSSTYLVHQMFGYSVSPDLNKRGYINNLNRLHEEELTSAEWLCSKSVDGGVYSFNRACQIMKVGGDLDDIHIDPYGKVKVPHVKSLKSVDNGPPDGSYIFLRYINVKKGIAQFLLKPNSAVSVSKFYDFGNNKLCKIYANGGSRIYRTQN